MVYGIDTGFLVTMAITRHADHLAAEQTIGRLILSGEQLAIAPQVITEFIHVVSDPRRFQTPLSIQEAIRVAEKWWTASEVNNVYPKDTSVRRCLSWIDQYSLGRKRLLDTLLAATYLDAGIRSILTTNPSDFAVFGVFQCIIPTMNSASP